MAAPFGSIPTSTTGGEYTTGNQHLMDSGHSRDREHSLSPLSPAESLESLPPTTPPDEYRYPNHVTFGGMQHATISGRLLEYPSPPATTSDPKYSVPLPSTKSTSNVNMNLYDFPYDPIHYDFVPSSPYTGGLLDSPRSVIPHSIYYTPNTFSLSQRTSFNPYRLLDGSTGTESPPSRSHALSPVLDFESLPPFQELENTTPNQLPPLEEEGDTNEDFAALLSPLSPEWESHALDVLPPPSPEVGITRLSRSPGPSSPPLPPLILPRSSSSRPNLPLLSIPNPSFTFPSLGTLRSYAPSPESSPLWLADELEPDGTDCSSRLEVEGVDLYVVSPPSSGPPDTPSPGVSLPPLPPLDWPEELEDGLDDHDSSGKGDKVSNGTLSPIPIPDLDEFEYPPSPPSLPQFSQPLPIPSLPPIPPIPLANSLSWSEPKVEYGERLETELLRSPSVKLREFVDLPDVESSGGGMPHSDGIVHPWPTQDEGDFDFEGLRQLEGPTTAGSSIPPSISKAHSSLLVPDHSNENRLPDIDGDGDRFDFLPERLKELPPQEVEEMGRIAELQARARECESVAKNLEAMVDEAIVRSKETNRKGKVRSQEEEDREENGGHGTRAGWEGEDLVVLHKAAVEARALAKREREKAREAGMLVKLKLKELAEEREFRESSPIGASGQSPVLVEHRQFQPLLDDAFSSPSPSTSGSAPTLASDPAPPTPSTPAPRKHPRLAGIAQLVAKMFLNRHDSGAIRPSTVLSPPSSPSLVPTPMPDPTSDRDGVSRPNSTSSGSTPPTSDTSSRPSPYKYKHLWVKGAAAGLNLIRPFTRGPSHGHGLGITEKLGPGATQQQPFARYHQRYKFLRSSPLARYSIVASDLDAEEGGDEDEGLDVPNSPKGRQLEIDDSGDGVGGLWDDDEDTEGGFEALRNPIMWDAI